MANETALNRQRADLGFDDDFEAFDPAEWAVGSAAPQRPAEGIARQAAEATGFRSREVQTATPSMAQPPAVEPPLRRRRTGRNAQFNLKARPETITAFTAVADAQGWGLGETLEHAVTLLQRTYPAP